MAPASAHKAPFSVSAVIAPTMLAGVTVVAMGNPAYAMIALASPLMVIGNWWETKHRSTRALRKDTRTFHSELATFEANLAVAQHGETRRRRAALPDLAEVTRRAEEGSVRLWERRRRHDDFLTLSLGWGDVRPHAAASAPATSPRRRPPRWSRP